MTEYIVTGHPLGEPLPYPYSLINESTYVGETVNLTLAAQDEAKLINAGILRFPRSDSGAVTVLNVKDFGALGDGSDATAAFKALRDAIKTSRIADPDAGAGFHLCTARGYIPAGRYLITDPGALMDDTGDAATNGTFGYEIFGDGEASRIIYSPSTAGPLFRNLNQYLFPRVHDLMFVGGNNTAVCEYSASSGTAQGWTYEDVIWWGTWNEGVQLDAFAGAANGNDSHEFIRCRVKGAWTGAFFHSGITAGLIQEDQAVVHQFVGCNLEPTSCGDIIRCDFGGHVQVLGGSMILVAGSGNCFNLPNGGSHNLGVCNLQVNGTRFEIRDAAGKIINCLWQFGSVTFKNVSNDGYATPSGQTVASFDGSGNCGPLVTWEDCSGFRGVHEYKYRTNAYQGGPSKASYKACTSSDHVDIGNMILHTDASGAGAIGAGWRIDFDDRCRGSSTFGAQSFGRSFRTVSNWRRQLGAEVQKTFYSIKTSFGFLPQNGASLTVFLPLGSIITAVHNLMPAKAGGSAVTVWTITLTNSDGTIYTFSPGTIWNLGYEDHQTLAAWKVLDTDARRQVTLTVTGVNDSSSSQLFLLEILPGN